MHKQSQKTYKSAYTKGGMYMAQINVTDLTYSYEGSFDTIFENVSFSIDTNWKLSLIHI